MAFLIGGANSGDTGYNIANSCRFDSDSDSSLGGTFGTPTEAKAFTLSMWFKKSATDATTSPFGCGAYEAITFQDGQMRIFYDNVSAGRIDWASLLRDTSAWYHFVIAQDTAQGTDTNRVKFYLNGTQITTYSHASWPAQDLVGGFNEDGQAFYVSSYNGTAWNVDGYYADVVFVDGLQYAASTFGETDEDSGIWKPKDISDIKNAVTFGNNGFCLEFKQSGTGTDASGLGADTSGNDNHLAVGGLAAIDQCTDTPTNNFCTLNHLAPVNGGAPGTLPAFSEGNTQITVGDGTARFAVGTFATSMPYYFEVKVSAISASDSAQRIGIVDGDAMGAATTYYAQYQGDGDIIASGETTVTGEDTFTANDIIGVAVDLATNNNVKFYENGDLQTTMSVGASYQGLSTTPFARLVNATTTFQFNFGNPAYANSSDAADANGYGAFEYAPPSGYYALCTKNLAKYGG